MVWWQHVVVSTKLCRLCSCYYHMPFLNVLTGRLSSRQYAEARVLIFLSRIGGDRERPLNFLQSTLRDILCIACIFCNIVVYIAIMCMCVCVYGSMCVCVYVCMYYVRTYLHERSSHSQSAFVHYATLFGHWKYFWRPEIRVVTSQPTGNIVLETCLLLGRQAVTEWILRNTVHRLFNVLHNISCQSNFIWLTQAIVQPFNIKSGRSVVLCSN
jgi:hypothetical protein